MLRSKRRPLFLHSSALSEAEYTVYVDALHDILDEPQAQSSVRDEEELSDEGPDTYQVAMRDARLWMRGRYKDVGVSNIDKILHLFTPHAQKDCISAGHFFAALRLLTHARSGSDVSETLLFVQANPSLPMTTYPFLHIVGTSGPTAVDVNDIVGTLMNSKSSMSQRNCPFSLPEPVNTASSSSLSQAHISPTEHTQHRVTCSPDTLKSTQVIIPPAPTSALPVAAVGDTLKEPRTDHLNSISSMPVFLPLLSSVPSPSSKNTCHPYETSKHTIAPRRSPGTIAPCFAVPRRDPSPSHLAQICKTPLSDISDTTFNMRADAKDVWLSRGGKLDMSMKRRRLQENEEKLATAFDDHGDAVNPGARMDEKRKRKCLS